MLTLPYHLIVSLSAVVPGGVAIVLVTLALRVALLPLALRGGLLAPLIQAPFFMILYRLFTTSTVDGHPNALLVHSILGARFFAHPGVLAFWLVFVALAAIAFFAARRLRGWLRVLPFFTVLVATYVPLAASIYLITSGAWTVLVLRPQ